MLLNCLQEVVMSTKEFPRVESQLLPDIQVRSKYLLSVDWEEHQVQELVAKAIRTFERNLVGPVDYIRLYDEYSDLLNGSAEEKKNEFLGASPQLDQFKARMDEYLSVKARVGMIKNSTFFGLFVIDATDLNVGLMQT